jgi:hypothetical protein
MQSPTGTTDTERSGGARLVLAWRVFPTSYTVEVAEKARACVRELVDVGVPPADVQLATADKAMRHGACGRVKWPADVTGLVGPSGVPTGIPVCRGGRRDRVT